MAKIVMRPPSGEYKCEVDTGVMDVLIKEVYLGVTFVTDTGNKLTVNMRDGGFEVTYSDVPPIINSKGHAY